MLVEWNERMELGAIGRRGTCIEVSRDETSTVANTLCGQVVTLPGPAIPGMHPTCSDCRKKRAARKSKKPVRWRDTCGSCSKRRMVEEFCGDQVCRECMPAAERDAAGVALEPYY